MTPNEEWKIVGPYIPSIRINGDDLLMVLGYEARCLEALAEAIAWQIAKDMGAPNPSVETYIVARQVAANTFYRQEKKSDTLSSVQTSSRTAV